MTYEFEGVTVHEGSPSSLASYINTNKPDKLLVHFLTSPIMNVFKQLQNRYPITIWVHGFEALGWYRRLFEFSNMGPLKFAAYIPYNMRQMLLLRQFVQQNQNQDVKFVYVSRWMKEIMEKDTATTVQNYAIIPNVIPTEQFPFVEKDVELRKKILTIRPFHSRKYANDISVEAILELSKRPVFSELEFTIYGKGKLFKKLTEPLRSFPNVYLHETFLNQSEIAEAHQKHGVFLCPTRQDAQGVSMCEAMSSGLVAISSNNTAIPEYVIDGHTGYTTSSAKEIADRIEFLYDHPDEFSRISEAGSKSIHDTCGSDIVISEELNVISK